MATTTDPLPTTFKPKKSVALSGTPAGNTALCTVGRTGNDLHYRGYDIADLAAHCEFEEVAYLLLRGKLPNATELAAYKQKLTRLRGLPANVYEVLEQLPAATHPMDVLRTGVSALGCMLPEKDDHNPAGAIECADVLLATTGSMLLYWHHYSRNGQSIDLDSGEDTLDTGTRTPENPRGTSRYRTCGAGRCRLSRPAALAVDVGTGDLTGMRRLLGLSVPELAARLLANRARAFNHEKIGRAHV